MLKVAITCTGLGRVNRGYETFTRECFDRLKAEGSFNLHLLKGAGESNDSEKSLFSVSRDSRVAKLMAKIIGRDAYAVEQISFGFSMIPYLLREKPDIVFFSDGVLGNVLWKLRKILNLKFKLLFSNGAPHVEHLPKCDHVQQLSPEVFNAVKSLGFTADRQTLLPYGFNIPKLRNWPGDDEKRLLREELKLPAEAWIVLSVGALNSSHKRMDYLITEFAKAEIENSYLVILGGRTEESPEVEKLASELLKDRCKILTVEANEVSNYYKAADCFSLASLNEGLGRAYVEALSYGLNCIVHKAEVMRFVLAEFGHFIDCSLSGELASALVEAYQQRNSQEQYIAERCKSAYDRFSWDRLTAEYSEMIIKTAEQA